MARNSPGNRGKKTAVAKTSIRLNTRLADEAVRVLGAKSRTEAVRVALREIVSVKRPEAGENNRQ
jgi:Arc/MetJ family transcription regulator